MSAPVEVRIVPPAALSCAAASAVGSDGRRIVFVRSDVADLPHGARHLWDSVRVAAVRDLPTGESIRHTHTYRDDIADWWCVECDTVTDYCNRLNPR